MQRVRELVLLPWLAQYPHANVESHFLRTTIISKWRLKSNKKGRYYWKSESFKHKDNFAVKEIKSMIENSLNPFNKDPDPDRLFNICTGKSCKKGTEDFLLNVESISNEARKSFIQERVQNPNQFEERIRKIKSTVLELSQGNERYGWTFKIAAYTCSTLLKTCR